MSISVIATGPYPFQRNQIHTITANATYTFFSGLLTTTDSFEDNIMDFAVGLKEIWLLNVGSNPFAFQFPELYIGANVTPPNAANVASGLVLGNDKINFRSCNKRGMKVRSLTSGSQTTLYVFGV